MDFYDILGISSDSSETDIKQAYRSLSFKFHPDRNKSSEASSQMQGINEAYETLSDKTKRKQYDMRNNNPLEQMLSELFKGKSRGGDPFEAIFKQQMMHEPIFACVTPQRHTFYEEPQKPPALDKKIDITFEESYKGIHLPINIEREIKNGKMSYHEQEKVYILIPPGIDDGEIIEISEKGNVYFDVKGSLKLYIKVMSGPLYERRGLNLIYNQSLNFIDSICGFSSILKHIDGSILKLNSSRGNIIQNGDEKTIKGRGFSRDDQLGDLVIKFKVVAPKELTEVQLALFESEL